MFRRHVLIAVTVLALGACARPVPPGATPLTVGTPESPVAASATVGRGGLTAAEINLATVVAREDSGSRGGDWPPNVDEVAVTVTTYDKASEDLIGGIPVTPGDHRRLLVITMEGWFTLSEAPHPPQASAPAGTCMTVVVDAATGRGLGMSLIQYTERCAAAGAVVLFSR